MNISAIVLVTGVPVPLARLGAETPSPEIVKLPARSRSAASSAAETLAPVDRDVFRRQVQYHSTTQGINPAKTATTAVKTGKK